MEKQELDAQLQDMGLSPEQITKIKEIISNNIMDKRATTNAFKFIFRASLVLFLVLAVLFLSFNRSIDGCTSATLLASIIGFVLGKWFE